jgi:3'-phosphoadenosine 5'-phosphosulfate sulfotransferase (PAPS reductase)/FAD synthetase
VLRFVNPGISLEEYHAFAGLPSDLVPAWSTLEGASLLPEFERSRQLLQSGLACCRNMLWNPLEQAVRASGTTLVLRGSKGTDDHVTAQSGTVSDGIEYISPLWEWTDAQVMEYLRKEGVELPMHYAEGLGNAPDCHCCTAWGNTSSEIARVRFTRKYYPQEFQALRDRMLRVRAAIQEEQHRIQPFWDEILNDD